jgi:hypothetical protein
MVTVMVSLTASSQTDTTAKSKDTTYIQLDKKVAKEVVKDLLRYDSALAELDYLKVRDSINQQSLGIKDSVIAIKDTVISVYKQKESYFNRTIFLKDQEISSYKNGMENVNKSYVRAKNRQTVYEIIIAFLVTTNLVAVLYRH